MGSAMSRKLIDAGHDVWVFDISPAAVKNIADAGGHAAASAAGAARNRDFVVTMLPNGPDVEETLFGTPDVARAMAKGALYIDMSTVAPDVTDRIAKCLLDMGIRMIDAPVGGTSEFAERGQLLILAGGDQQDVEAAQPVFDAVGRETIYCGVSGAGTRTKLVNNYMSTALNVLTAEVLTFAEVAGLDVMRTVKILAGTTAGKGFLSGAYDRKIFSGDISPEFGLALASKDLNLALNYGANLNVPLSIGAAASQIYAISRAEGFGQNDWSSVLETLRLTATLPGKKLHG